MGTLKVALCAVLLLLPVGSRADDVLGLRNKDHDRIIHDLAHSQGGALVAGGLALVFRRDPSWRSQKWTLFTTELAAALAVNHLYMLVTEKANDTTLERDLAALVGAGFLSWQINF